MKPIATCVLLLVLVGFPYASASQPPLVVCRFSPERVVQGGIAALILQSEVPIERASVQIGGRDIPLQRSRDGRLIAWVGVDLDQPTGVWEFPVAAFGAGGQSSAAVRLIVESGGYPVQRLAVPRTFTELDPATLARVDQEKAVLDRLWEVWTPERVWRGGFQAPVSGAGKGFGVRRIINGEPRAPHTGQDYAAAAGTQVVAAKTGRVALEADQFFSGKSLILDHGQGLYTMYFHLADFIASPGQLVAKGEPIARVGSTGRATGPHLHWGARLNGARINPEALLHLAE